MRWFDPLEMANEGAGAEPSAAAGAGATITGVVAAAHVRQDMQLRIEAREVRFDEDHRWLREPAELVRVALERGGFSNAGRIGQVRVELTAFELVLPQSSAPPMARIAVELAPAAPSELPIREPRVEVVQAATDDSIEALVAAMAMALSALPDRVRAALDR
ncbi:MAG: hypothetical protein AB8H80_13160 [Planctomycetota bacterium]